jgi:hypothetical protein
MVSFTQADRKEREAKPQKQQASSLGYKSLIIQINNNLRYKLDPKIDNLNNRYIKQG